jgi:manganese transport protein
VKRFLEIFLGILTAIGGFVDIGELVTGPAVGARFRFSLLWAALLALVGIVIFAEMAGRVACVSHRPVFDIVRDRLGPRVALVNLIASFLVTLATVAAEIGGVALALQLATSVNYLLWIPVVAIAAWLLIWYAKFETIENAIGLLGLALLVTTLAVFKLHPDWSSIFHEASHPAVPANESVANYFYYGIALFGAGLMPYEVFFFSSGAIEQGWGKRDLIVARANVLIGFPLGAILTFSLVAGGALVLSPRSIEATQLFQAGLPVSLALGKIGLAVAILGFVACTFGAAVETAFSCGYTIAQYFGWQWGKVVRPRDDARFHTVLIVSVFVGALLVLTTIDPVKLTEYVVVFSAAALPLTYFPVLVVANDPEYMGDKVNGRFANATGFVFLALIVVVSIATIPLLIITKGGG